MSINPGQWILKNYQDALNRIKTEQLQLDTLLESQKLKPEDLERLLDEERQYLDGLTDVGEDDETSISAQYVQLLDKLRSAESDYAFEGPASIY